MRADLRCPLCGDIVNVQLTIESKLIHTVGNGRKGLLTADVGIGGMEHTCDPRCNGNVGRRPDWMGVDQYDPCRCTLPNGHAGAHTCEHEGGPPWVAPDAWPSAHTHPSTRDDAP